MSYTVKVGYDKDKHLYHVLAADIPGLNVEAETFEQFVEIVQDVAPDLLDRAEGVIRFEREVDLVA